MGRPSLDHDAKRLEIAEATCRTIVERGLRGIKLRDIAATLNVTTGTLQHYYATKEDLLRHAKEFLADRQLARCERIAQGKKGLQRLQAMCETLLPLDRERYEMWLITTAYAGQTIGDALAMQVMATRYQRAVDIFAMEIKRLQGAGFINPGADPNLEALSLLSFIEGMAMHVLFSVEQHRRPHQRRMMARYLKNVLGKPFD